MFKKLFGSILGNNEEENKQQQPQNQHASQHHEDNYDDEYDDDENYENEDDGDAYDPETLHGKHYTIDQFNAEVESRAKAWIAREERDGVKLEQKDIDNIYFNYRREVYTAWNNCSQDQMLRWEMANSMTHMGIATSGFVKEDSSNPFLQPVHGIDLRTYTAMAKKIGSGVDYTLVCKAMNLEPAIWEELNTVWPQRMAEDTSFTVTTLFGQYYGESLDDITQLANIEPEMSDSAKEYLQKMKTDPYFYEELEGARQAAYNYGMDGAQWILDNFGINLAQFQEVAMMYMEDRNKNWNSNEISQRLNHRTEKP
ncbi:MAG: hypothetical protein BGN96_05570 [Bacteroidales bacterium 45-6]|uniref:DUF6620 family protein n=1 Tax=uncultured Dysgonomonas sp. TaxID=206096 RepID=UPI00096419E9|nr:DUF6620 family protein [uncultured Dysgonomonas sp.]OJU47949.1 MAG: hypothetical protein BGN96_05570 [Bacteroidales bacterium 45-6]